MLSGDNPARAGEDSYGKSEAIMIPPKGTGPLLKQMFFVKHFSLKKASEFPVFSEGFSLL